MARYALCLVLGFAGLSSAVTVTPVQQVIAMLQEMEVKGKKSMAAEKMVFTEYSKWADTQETSLSQEITVAKSDIEKLTAHIEKVDSDVANLGRKIADLDNQIAGHEKQLADEKTMREEQHASFEESEQDLAESVEALQMAISTLKAQDYDRPQAMLQLQKMAGKVPAMRKVLAALLQTDEQNRHSDPGAPEVAAYEFQSGRIIDVLESLLEKFKGQLSEAVSAESNEAHAYDLSKLHLDNMVSQLEDNREEDASAKANYAADSAESKGKLASIKADLAEDEASLKDIKATFAQKESQFTENQQVRAMELEALAEAIAILKDPKVSASYAKHVEFNQKSSKETGKKAPSFLQMNSRSAAAKAQIQARVKGRVEKYLRSKAVAISSKVLAQAASDAAANPFAKVIEMIEALLAKLKEEAAKESDHKQWCDAELAKNKAKREKKSSKVEELAAKVSQLEGKASSEAATITKLAAEQAELATAMSEATAQRTEEKETNLATIKDAKEAIVAVQQAIGILKEFYSSQGASLVQAKQVPEMAAYKGMQNAKGGVVGMLEVILSDFSRLEAETSAAEAQAAKEYSSFMAESKALSKAKHDEEFKTSLAKDQTIFDKEQVEKDLAATQAELDEATKYFEYLKPNCNQVHVSYEERVAKREEEIKALKEAYKMLDEISV